MTDDHQSASIALNQVYLPQCEPVFRKLRKCMKDHPQRSPTSVVCEKFVVMAGWCVTRTLCGRQSLALEDCCGGIPELVRCPVQACRREQAALNACMEAFTKDSIESYSDRG